MKSAWEAVKAELSNTLSDHHYRMWIEPLQVCECDGAQMVLVSPNPFSRKWVQDHYGAYIKAALTNAVAADCQLVIKVQNPKETSRSQEPRFDPQLPLPQIKRLPHNGHHLRRDFTFDEFVVGACNGFAYSASRAFAAQRQPQSLFLLSKTGLGKSHLSQAIGHYILAESPADRVYYLTAEEFTSEVVEAFKTNSVAALKRKYRQHCDVLLLEDVQYLSGKETTQIELALTLETLLNANKRIIFSSSCRPAEIPRLNDKLRSRLISGLISTIDPPDYQTRVKILQKKDAINRYHIPNEVIQYLAAELTANVRELKNGLENVATRANLQKVPISLDLARRVVGDIVQLRKNITISVIKKLVCKYYRITEEEIISPSRKQGIVKPRQIAIYLARKYTDQPLQLIGKSFNRYHPTVLHAMKTVERKIEANERTRSAVEYLSKKLDEGDY